MVRNYPYFCWNVQTTPSAPLRNGISLLRRSLPSFLKRRGMEPQPHLNSSRLLLLLTRSGIDLHGYVTNRDVAFHLDGRVGSRIIEDKVVCARARNHGLDISGRGGL